MSDVNENPEMNLPSNLDNNQYRRNRMIQSRVYICDKCGASFPVLEGKFKACKRCVKVFQRVFKQDPRDMDFSNLSPIQQIDKQPTYVELVRGTDRCKLADMHAEKVKALLIYDPKRKAVVPSRFCSFHLASFDHDEETKVPLGPPYESGASNLAGSSINVISLRVVKAGPEHTYPVEVYGRVIVRDEVDYKSVFLFDHERKDAQFINSEKDMLALTGPRRALVTDGLMCFEFDLKVKGKGGPDCDVQFSKGVILYRHNFYNKRMVSQLPSFQSTVKLVLQHVASPMAASVEVNIVKKQLGDRTVHFNGKITVGTTRNYRQHMVVYDSSLPSGDLVTETGSLVLDRNLLAVPRRIRDNTLKGDEQETIYVCFLGAGSEIEDEDYIRPEEEDDDEDEDDDDEEEGIDEEESAGEEEDGEDPTNLVALKYPLSETLWEYGSLKLKVKVHWTAIIEAPLHGEFLTRLGVLPEGYKLPDYRRGSADGSFCE